MTYLVHAVTRDSSSCLWNPLTQPVPLSAIPAQVWKTSTVVLAATACPAGVRFWASVQMGRWGGSGVSTCAPMHSIRSASKSLVNQIRTPRLEHGLSYSNRRIRRVVQFQVFGLIFGKLDKEWRSRRDDCRSGSTRNINHKIDI